MNVNNQKAINDLVSLTKHAIETDLGTSRISVTLFALVVTMRARRVLELGVADGESTRPLLLGCCFSGGTLVSVDNSHTPFRPPNYARSLWTFRLTDAISFLEECVRGHLSFDLIFVDDCHEYPHVKRELELISQMVDNRTLIVLHDLMQPNMEPNYTPLEHPTGSGPRRAVMDLKRDQWEYSTIPVSHGLTILRKI